MTKILIVKMSSLGDIIQAFPILSYIKQCDPQAEIDWVVEKPFAELLRAHPLVHRILCVQTKKWRSNCFRKESWQEIASFYRELRQFTYHVILDLQGNIKSGCITAGAKGITKMGFGFASVPEWPNLLATRQRCNPPRGKNIREDYLFVAQKALQHFAPIQEQSIKLKLTPDESYQLALMLESYRKIPYPKILVCPGSNWPNKQLSKSNLQNFLLHVVKHLRAHLLFIWGHPNEKILAQELAHFFSLQSSVVDKLSLPVLQNLMAHVDLVIAVDSLPLHLAGTTQTPTFSIFGASAAHKYKPMGDHHAAFQGICPYGKQFDKRCDRLRTCPTGACIKNLEGEKLFDEFLKWWVSRGQASSERFNG